MAADRNVKCWAVVPAAGMGQRFGGRRAKQYVQVNGRGVLGWTLDALLAVRAIQWIVVALAREDAVWPELGFADHPRIITCIGGATRAESVRNGLQRLVEAGVEPQQPVLIHDAARPCVTPAEIERLIAEVGNHPDGGLLAMPVRDTLKRADSAGRIAATVSRSRLWQALTPQLFPLGRLLAALEQAAADGIEVTDEAQALEHIGGHPRLVEGALHNIKLTHPSDQELIERILVDACFVKPK
ncbi:MAG TPA: 2-C-methyl-D-erythritol 4-phosphate cytidylyltransferase [Nitrococcus sp.]|nr:2-C-methyl-D-erythritol 4-phosphate cytidylyltransferase [Nitrococcus sp.]